MKRLSKVSMVLATVGLLSSGTAQAELFDRGGGLLYDNVLNVTWLQDANYAKTSGYDTDGRMSWSAANTWASSLNISRFTGESLTGWRLAANTPVGAEWNFNDYALAYNGNADFGYNIINPNNELSYMYYVNLGLKGLYSPAGVEQIDFGVFGNGTIDGQADVGLVKNLQSFAYWSGTAFPKTYLPDFAFRFNTYQGDQFSLPQNFETYAWAVRPGDVAAVPEPETYAIFLAGLALIGTITRRRKSKPV